jgi:hypothetical protein
MGIETLNNPTDDSQFVELVKHVIARLGTENCPEKVFIVKIDNWFDHKWLNFSGIGRAGFFWGPNAPDTVLHEFSQDKATFPPFNPKRVIGEWYFLRGADGSYVLSLDSPLVHQRALESSSHNLHKRVTDFAESAIFVWWSSNTKRNQLGSLMVYEVNGASVNTWYLTLSKDDNWRISQTKGIAREQAASLIELALPQGRT